MFKIFAFFILLRAMIMVTHSAASDRLKVPWNVTIPDESVVPLILNAIGGIDQLQVEVQQSVEYASLLRQGIPASLVEFQAGGGGLIGKICFADGICWSDKMIAGEAHIRGSYFAIAALTKVHKYCPGISIPKFKGAVRDKLHHYYTEWIEGQSLYYKLFGPDDVAYIARTINIPNKIVISLSEFVYNLTTCPIPKEESMKQYRRVIDG